MIYLNEINDENTFDLKQTKAFLKAIKGNKYECYFKLIMAYEISRMELVNIKWEDIDFENNTIKIYPIKQGRNSKFYYGWDCERKTNLVREFPLLPSIKKLLLELKEKQLKNSILRDDYNFNNQEYVALKDNGTRLNYNTLSRNLRYVGRDNNLPQILLSGLSCSLDDFICHKSHDYEYYRAWTRFDVKFNKLQNVYANIDLKRNKRFLINLNDLLDIANQSRKSDMEMWGAIWVLKN